MSQVNIVQEIGGKLYSIRPDFYARVCPFCGRERKTPKDSRGHGFAVAGFSRHIEKCFFDTLAASGYRETRYDPDVLQFPVEPIEG